MRFFSNLFTLLLIFSAFFIHGCGGGGSSTTATSDPEKTVAIYFSHQSDGLYVKFTPRMEGNATATAYEWDFGDNSSSDEQSPSHIYQSGGTYEVNLTIVDVKNKRYNSSQIINVDNISQGMPAAVFTYTIDSTDTLMVSFTSISAASGSASLEGYVWNFGDDTVSSVKNPIHVYASGGSYTVSLTVIDSYGNTDKSTKNLTVFPLLPHPAVIANFTYNIDEDDRLKVNFTDTSIAADNATVATYGWIFGDGNTSAASNPVHTYNTSGLYAVTLSIVDSNGSNDTVQKNINITAIQNSFPVDYEYTADVNNPLKVSFTAKSHGNGIQSYRWDFGDGNNSTEQTPTHTYALPGTYEVILTATDSIAGDNSTLKQITVNALLPIAEFLYSVNNLTVNFTDNSSSGSAQILNYTWDFGDSNSSPTKNPTHSYTATGLYIVTLTVTDKNNLSGTAVKHINLSVPPLSPPKADFTYSKDTINTLKINFQDNSSGSAQIKTYAWAFGDKATSSEQNPTHTYTAAGTYTITLKITDINGLTDTITKSITLYFPPTAGFTYTIDASDTMKVHFIDSSSDTAEIKNHTWVFGDGNSSSEQNPSHKYAIAGMYTVTLLVTDVNNLSAKITKNIEISAPPVPPTADYTYNTDSTDTLAITFTDTSNSENPIATYTWDFGDNSTSTEKDPVHIYAAEGEYTVRHSVTDSKGLAGTVSKNLRIFAPLSPPTITIDYSYIADSSDSLNIIFTASATASLPGATVNYYRWDFGNGDYSLAQNPAYRYKTNGQYTVKLQVADSDGKSGEITKTVNVTSQGAIPISADKTTINLSNMIIDQNGTLKAPSDRVEFTAGLAGVQLTVIPGTSAVLIFAPDSTGLNIILTPSTVSQLITVTVKATHAHYNETEKQFILNINILNGSDEFPYIVSTEEDLDSIRYNLNAHFSLRNDIILTGSTGDTQKGWIPLGNDISPFKGAFYGNGHTIRNLWIKDNQSGYSGLFGYIENTKISELNLKGKVNGGKNSGILAGFAHNSSLTKISVSGRAEGGENVGGIAGVLDYSSIDKSFSTADVNSKNDRALAGGLAGLSSNSDIKASYSSGTVFVSGNNSKVGGIAGEVFYGTVSDCFALNKIVSASGENSLADHIAGLASSTGINNTAWSGMNGGDVNGQWSDTSGAVALADISALRTTNAYNSWDFINVWQLSGIESIYEGFPVLRTGSDIHPSGWSDSGHLAINTGMAGTSTASGSNLLLCFEIPENNRTLVFSNIKAPSGSNLHFNASTKNCLNISAQNSPNGAYELSFKATEYEQGASVSEKTYNSVLYVADGSTQAPYVIIDDRTLNNIRNNLDKNFILADDIHITFRTVAPETGWASIGSAEIPFSGILNGNGYIVSGLFILDSENPYRGLFSYTGTASEIINLSIDGAFMESKSSFNLYTGVIAGYNSGKISNCNSNGVIKTANQAEKVFTGGLAGVNTGNISESRFSGTIKSEQSVNAIAGGIAGTSTDIIDGNITGTISNVYFSGSIYAEALTAIYAGGIAGAGGVNITNSSSVGGIYVKGAMHAIAGGISAESNTDIHDVSSSINIKAEGSSNIYIGGISGMISGNIKNAHASGTLTTPADNTASAIIYIGGVSGYSEGNVANGSYTGNISAKSAERVYLGGISGMTYNGNISGSAFSGTLDAAGSYEFEFYGGGLVGRLQNSNIFSSYAAGNMEIMQTGYADLYVGGIVGTADSSTSGTGKISQSYYSGGITVESFDDGYILAGGIAGNLGGQNKITDSYSKGNFAAKGLSIINIGGIAGKSTDSEISNSYSSATVTFSGSNNSSAGGIAGTASGGGSIKGSVAAGENLSCNVTSRCFRVAGYKSSSTFSGNYGRTDMLRNSSVYSWTSTAVANVNGANVSAGSLKTAAGYPEFQFGNNESSPWRISEGASMPYLYWE